MQESSPSADLANLRAWVQEFTNSFKSYSRSKRLEIYGYIRRYYLERKARGTSLREVSRELGMNTHTMLLRWMKAYEKHLSRTRPAEAKSAQRPAPSMQTSQTQIHGAPKSAPGRIRVKLPDGTEFETESPEEIPAILESLRASHQ